MAIYFLYDAEDGVVDANIPEDSEGIYFEQSTTEGYTKGTVRNTLTPPTGTKYWGYAIAENQSNAENDIRNYETMPFVPVLGTTYYLGWFFYYQEIDGNEVYYTEPPLDTYDCFDKGIEMSGDGLRWNVASGMRQWESLQTELPAHHWSHWHGNPTHHLNPELENYDYFYPNQNGYDSTNWPYVPSGRWNSVVLAVKMAKSAQHDGSSVFWLNGVKISEYTNIQTLADVDCTFDRITIHGTL